MQAETVAWNTNSLEASGMIVSSNAKIEEYLFKWLSLIESQDLISSYVSEMKETGALNASLQQNCPASPRSVTPPRSPTQKSRKKLVDSLLDDVQPGSPRSPSPLQSPRQIKKSRLSLDRGEQPTSNRLEVPVAVCRELDMSDADGQTKTTQILPLPVVGRKRGLPLDPYLENIQAEFEPYPHGLVADNFVTITKQLCQFPTFFSGPLFIRILMMYPEEKPLTSNAGERTLTQATFLKWWLDEMEPFDRVERFFRLMKSVYGDAILPVDLLPYMQELLLYHPGLEFLESTPEFQEKYVRTVICRIFYGVNVRLNGRISLSELRRSDLLPALDIVDTTPDINAVQLYFSYEHFYVLYCKFWELDSDHDFLLRPEDLQRYGGHCLTTKAVGRVFSSAPRAQGLGALPPLGGGSSVAGSSDTGSEQKQPEQRSVWLPSVRNRMTYEDFVFFLLSEEDKGNERALRYWFQVIDLDGDGVIRAHEMKEFYAEQLERMMNLGHEAVPFEDILTQMSDCIKPKKEGDFKLSDFLDKSRVKVCGVFFNLLVNLNKFIAYEQRDPFSIKQMQAEPHLTDWDRFARTEYARLAMEEDSRGDGDFSDEDSDGGWDDG